MCRKPVEETSADLILGSFDWGSAWAYYFFSFLFFIFYEFGVLLEAAIPIWWCWWFSIQVIIGSGTCWLLLSICFLRSFFSFFFLIRFLFLVCVCVGHRSRDKRREKGFIPLQLLQQRHYRKDPYQMCRVPWFWPMYRVFFCWSWGDTT